MLILCTLANTKIQLYFEKLLFYGLFQKVGNFSKEVMKAECDAMAMPEIDDKYCSLLISEAKEAIDALAFDENKSFDENLAALDAITKQLAIDLSLHRGSIKPE